MNHEPPRRQTKLLITGGILCFAMGAGTVLVFDSLRESVRQSIRPEKTSRRADTQDLDSIPIQPLPQATPTDSRARAFPALPGGSFGAGMKDAEDMVREAQKLMDSFMEDQFTVPPIRGTGLDGISKREDSTHVYYDVPIEGLKKEDIDIQVGDGQISVSGKIEKENFFSSFHRTFPIPDGVDETRAKIQPLPDKLVIEFPKK